MNKEYINFIAGLKQNIIQSRYTAARLANKEALLLYFKTGKMLSEKIAAEKWGAKVLEQIAEDLQKQLPGLKGFSHRNLKNMRQFALAYETFSIRQTVSAQLADSIMQSPTAQLPETWYNISFSHHMSLINKCKSNEERFFYMGRAAAEFWSLRILEHHINANLYKHQGKIANNFNTTLPGNLKTNALQVFQAEYLFDFVALDEDDERVIEGQLVLKRGKFKPAYAGQLNFYLNVLDEKVKLSHENPSIGIILCKEKNNTIVEFAVKTIDKAMGVATYRTTKEVPNEMKGILPDADDLAKLLG